MSNNRVLATVGQRVITENDADRIIKSIDPQTSMQFKTPQGKERLVQELVNQELFYLDAIDKKLDQDEEFKLQLERTKSDMIKQYAINKLLSSIAVSEDEILEYYNQNIMQFKNPESVKASHILVDSEEKAHSIYKEVEEGLSFEAAAAKYSSCPSSEQGGDLGYFTKGRMVPEFEKAAFEMENGQVSKPVKTQFGYHLIKLADKKQQQSKSFEEVKGQISQKLLGKKQEDTYFKKIDTLKRIYEIKINE